MKLPYLLDKEKLSGIGITKVSSAKNRESYKDKLFGGAELSVYLQSETPQRIEIKNSIEDELIWVSSGTVAVTPKIGKTQTFYTGDFFILPKGFTGTWESKGHHLFRSLRVKKAE